MRRLTQQEIETIKNREKLLELKERDPKAFYKIIIKSMSILFLSLSIACWIAFLIFRYADVCRTPDSICDFRWWGIYWKKCYACSRKWIFYQEERKEAIDESCINLECPEGTYKGCINWSSGKCKYCECKLEE